MSDHVSDCLSDRISDHLSDKMSDKMSDGMLMTCFEKSVSDKDASSTSKNS